MSPHRGARAPARACRREDFPPYEPRRPHGQALVEFALVMPIALGLFLGGAELAVVGFHQELAQRAAGTLADMVAITPAMAADDPAVTDEAHRAGCATFSAAITWPDDSAEPGDRVAVALECHFASLTTSDRLVTAAATAVVAP